MSLPSLLPAATFQLTTSFDDTFDDTLTGSIIGAGLLTYTAEAALTDGVYAWDSLVDPHFVAQFGEKSGLVFSANSSSPGYFGMAGAVVEVRGSSFFFSWIDPGDDESRGNIYLENEPMGMALMFEPVPPSNWFEGYPGLTPKYVILDTAAEYPPVLGNYGVASAIPEPSNYALMAGAATLGLVVIRRKTRKSAGSNRRG